MNGSPIERLSSLAPVAGYAVGALLLTAVGLRAELASASNFAAGDAVLGVWLGVMGLVALYFGAYLMGYEQLRERLSA